MMSKTWTPEEIRILEQNCHKTRREISRLIEEKTGNIRPEGGISAKLRDRGLMKHRATRTGTTLCWDCKRALPREIDGIMCPWVKTVRLENPTPVEGWTAEQTTIGRGQYKSNSFLVKECPLFIHDKS